ncbi:MAG: M28 family peptidase [Candidatus Binatia bacterium]
MREHARDLASDEFGGRGVGTPGIELARDYIAREFARSGLRPGGDDGTYLQTFDVTTAVAVKPPTSLSFGDGAELALNQDWIPLGFSASTRAETEVAFVGYGISAKDYGYDDYDGIDVKGKIVIVLRYEPPPKDANSPFRKYPDYSVHAALRTKANNARDHGAAAMILVDLKHTGAENNELISIRSSLWRAGNTLIAAQVRRSVMEDWLQTQDISLTALQENIDREERPASMIVPNSKIALQVKLAEVRQRTANVVGILPGSDPALKDQNIVIGAHYDHLGLGYYGTRDSSTEGQIHHGADDNASGTAVLMDLARRMSERPRPARTIIFAAFSGEELGLYGSRHYVNNPSAPLSSTKAMLNLDMVGRLRENRARVYGARSAQELSGIVTGAAHELGLEISESDGVGRSDHMAFYNRKVPALHFFTGTHADYHRPSDTWDKLNIEGMAKISDLVTAVAQQLADTKAPMSFVSLPSFSPGRSSGDRQGLGIYLGSIPDYAGTDEGVRLAGVAQGSPAAIAGLREGDVIIKLAESQIQNLEDLTVALGSKKPGDEVEIVVLRTGKPVTMKVTLRARS